MSLTIPQIILFNHAASLRSARIKAQMNRPAPDTPQQSTGRVRSLEVVDGKGIHGFTEDGRKVSELQGDDFFNYFNEGLD